MVGLMRLMKNYQKILNNVVNKTHEMRYFGGHSIIEVLQFSANSHISDSQQPTAQVNSAHH